MRKLVLALAFACLSLPAWAQNVNNPLDAAVAGAYNASPATCTSGKFCRIQTDINGILKVNIVAGGGSGGTASSFGAAFPSLGTASGFSDGTNMQPGLVDGSGNLKVNCATGCAGGTFNNNADGVATSNTNGQSAAWLYAFNGTTWDRIVNGAGTATLALRITTASNSPDVTALGAVGDSAWSSGNGSIIAIVKTIANNTGAAIPAGSAIIGKVGIDQTTPGTTNGVQVNAALPAGSNVIGTVNQASQYPAGAVAITASATGTTGATTATLAGTSGKTTYICGYSIRANATAAATVTNTITGVITATLSSIMWIAPLASGIGVDEQIFSPCIPASATNTAIAIVSGAPGTGGTVSSKGWGYQL